MSARRLASRLAPILAGLALSAAIVAPAAPAATYDVDLCSQNGGDGRDLPFGIEAGTVGIHPVKLCGTGVGQIFGLFTDTETEVKKAAAFRLEVPVDLRIKEVKAFRSSPNPWPAPAIVWEVIDGESQILERFGATIAPANVTYAVDSTSVTFGLRCTLIGGCPIGTSPAAASLSQALATIEDPEPPRVRVEAMVPGPVRGTVQVPFRATDDGGGVRKVTLNIDGADVNSVEDTNGGRCVRPFRSLVPCQAVLQASLGLDTTRLENGPHQVKFIAVDAADVQTESIPVTIMVDNPPVVDPPRTPTPPTVPATLTPALKLPPALGGVSLSRKSFQAGKRTLLRFTSSEAGTLSVAISPVAGAAARGQAAMPLAILKRPVGAGAGSLAIGSRINGKALPPGPYMLRLSVRDADGQVSATSILRLKILPK
jgi:hypothetical protein